MAVIGVVIGVGQMGTILHFTGGTLASEGIIKSTRRDGLEMVALGDWSDWEMGRNGRWVDTGDGSKREMGRNKRWVRLRDGSKCEMGRTGRWVETGDALRPGDLWVGPADGWTGR